LLAGLFHSYYQQDQDRDVIFRHQSHVVCKNAAAQ
jgi:hypothetical protein